jgi:hypothetical protein
MPSRVPNYAASPSRMLGSVVGTRPWASHAALGPQGPSRPVTVRQGQVGHFGRKLGRASRNLPRAGFGNLKFIFHFLGYFKSDSNFQNSYQIHFLSKNYETSSIILLNLRSIQ